MNTINTIERPVNMFNATSGLAEKAFNKMLGRLPTIVLPTKQITDTQTGAVFFKDSTREAYAGALTLVFANKGTSDAWLTAGLTKILGINVSIDASTIINRFFISEGLVEHRSIKRTTLDRQGFERTDKIWPLTAAYIALVQKAIENLPQSFKPEGSVYQAKTLVKGKSSASECSLGALHKLNNVALALHKDTEQVSWDYTFAIDAGTEKELKSKMLEVTAINDLFTAHGTKPFYLTHTQDFRGRIYSRGGMISTQGSKLMKSCIRFAEPRTVDMDEVTIYLGRLAGCKGDNTEAYIAGEFQLEAPSSFEAQSVIGDPERAIIRLDGCSNGIQWMSAFMNDETGLKLTNLSGEDTHDLYSVIRNRLELDSRNEAKNLVMPYSYGAGINSLMDNLNEGREEHYSKSEVELMILKINNILPISKYLYHIQKNLAHSKATSYEWMMPDGFVVVQDYRTHTKIEAGSLSKMKIYATENVDQVKMNGALAPNIIHSIDAYHARLIAKACDFPIVSIHDSFGCHSSNVKALRRIIRETFQQIVSEDVLNLILCQLKLSDREDSRSFMLLGKPVDAGLITNSYMFM